MNREREGEREREGKKEEETEKQNKMTLRTTTPRNKSRYYSHEKNKIGTATGQWSVFDRDFHFW